MDRLRGCSRSSWVVAGVYVLVLAVLIYMYWGSKVDKKRMIAQGDGHITYLALRSLVIDHDIDFSNDAKRFDAWREKRSPTGRVVMPLSSMGPVFVWAPVMGLAHGVSKIANFFGADIESHGYTYFHQRFVFITGAFFGLFAALFGYFCARTWIGGRWGPLWASLTVLFGTNVVYYATSKPAHSHAMEAFFCAIFLGYWAATIDRRSWRRFAWLGLWLGMCALVRITTLALGIVVVLELARWVVRAYRGGERGKVLARTCAILFGYGSLSLAVVALVLVPQFIAWKILYGEIFASPNGHGYVDLTRPAIVELLYSSRNGWFSTHPIVYMSVIGLFLVPRKARFVGGCLLVVVGTQLYINASVYDWWGIGSFGARRLCSLTFVLIVGMAALLRACDLGLERLRCPRLGRVVLGMIVLGWFVAWNLFAVGKYDEGKIRKGVARDMCCDWVPEFMADIARPIYKRVGNPAAFPANALFAAKHGVTWRRWDQVVGKYAARPKFVDFAAGRHLGHTYAWNIPGVNFGPMLLGGFGPRQRYHKRNFRWTTAKRASFFLPLFLRADYEMSLPMRPNLAAGNSPVRVRVAVNGRWLYDEELGPGWTKAAWLVPRNAVQRSVNVITIETQVRPYEAGRGDPTVRKPPKPVDVGVAVRMLGVTFMTRD